MNPCLGRDILTFFLNSLMQFPGRFVKTIRKLRTLFDRYRQRYTSLTSDK